MNTQNRTKLSIFIGLWLGVTVVAGLCVFVGLYMWLGAQRRPAATVAPTVPPTAPLAQPTEPTEVVEPGGQAPEATAGPDTSAGGGEPACNWRPAPGSGFGYGVQSHVFVGDNDYWLGVITDKLGFDWVKMQVRWYDLQQTPDGIFWDVLDAAMNEACEKGLRVMLSVVAAPAWTMANPLPADQGQEAPPDDPQTYADFLTALIDRYPGRIHAIEVWNEMNLEREWNTAGGVNVGEYVALLRVAHTAIKGRDPNIMVISGALAPTGINCNGAWPDCQPTGRAIVVDDVTYLRDFVSAGGLQYADCVGTHSNGTNLPPSADGANPPPRTDETFTGPWDSPHYSWALRSQVETYAALLNGQAPQCVTEFGYASAVGGVFPPNYGFAADVSEQEQAQNLVDAFDWMRQSGLVKLAFLFNLDYGPKGGDPATDDNVIFSILTRDGAPRPAFDALGAMAKP